MPSTKILLAAAAACFLLALAVPTVAISVGEDTASDDVVLEATDERYATIENGELELDLSVLTNTMTTMVDVFSITVGDDADTVEEIWIDHDVEGVTFYGDSGEITSDARLEPATGETIRVGVAVDAYVAESATESFTIHVAYEDDDPPGGEGSGDGADDGDDDDDDTGDDDDTDDDNGDDEPKPVSLESLEVDPTTLEVGESVTVTATYRNEDSETPQTITSELTVDGTVVDSKPVDIGPGATETVTFVREMQWAGTYAVGVDGVASERVTVEERSPGPPVSVSAATTDTADITTGETVRVTATVTNPTAESVERTLEFAVDGIVVETRTVVVPAGEERTVTFDHRFDAPGTYEISVSGTSAGSVTVSEAEPTVIWDRQLSSATTAALAPPLTMGFLFLGIAANRRWAIVPT